MAAVWVGAFNKKSMEISMQVDETISQKVKQNENDGLSLFSPPDVYIKNDEMTEWAIPPLKKCLQSRWADYI